MKGLTLHQPWASLVAIGAKRIETRSWRLKESVEETSLSVRLPYGGQESSQRISLV